MKCVTISIITDAGKLNDSIERNREKESNERMPFFKCMIYSIIRVLWVSVCVCLSLFRFDLFKQLLLCVDAIESHSALNRMIA